MSFRSACIAVCALAGLGLGRSVWFHAVVESREPRAARSDLRYEPARRLLAGSASAGYVSDEPVDVAPGEVAHLPSTRRYQQALYALAPVVLRYGDDRAPLVLANLGDPARMESVLREHHLQAVALLAPDLAVAKPLP
jgi:hypothetical protein